MSCRIVGCDTDITPGHAGSPRDILQIHAVEEVLGGTVAESRPRRPQVAGRALVAGPCKWHGRRRRGRQSYNRARRPFRSSGCGRCRHPRRRGSAGCPRAAGQEDNESRHRNEADEKPLHEPKLHLPAATRLATAGRSGVSHGAGGWHPFPAVGDTLAGRCQDPADFVQAPATSIRVAFACPRGRAATTADCRTHSSFTSVVSLPTVTITYCPSQVSIALATMVARAPRRGSTLMRKGLRPSRQTCRGGVHGGEVSSAALSTFALCPLTTTVVGPRLPASPTTSYPVTSITPALGTTRTPAGSGPEAMGIASKTGATTVVTRLRSSTPQYDAAYTGLVRQAEPLAVDPP